MNRIYLLVVLAGLFLTRNTNAQTLDASQYKWQNVVVGGGGYVTGIVFSEAQKNLVYARTDVGGAYRLDTVSNSWIQLLNWIGAGETMLRDVESIAPDPVDANRLYIATGEWGITRILRSSDQGKTFTRIAPPFNVAGNGNGRGKAERMVVDPNKTNILFYGSRNEGLFKSVDYGSNWTKVSSFPYDTTADGIGITFILFNKKSSTSGNPTNDIYIGRSSRGNKIYKSSDAGVTWQVITGAPGYYKPHDAGLDTTGMLYISFSDNEGPNGINSGVVYKYNTRTPLWTNITPPTGQGGFGGLAVDRNKPGTVMVSTICRWWPGDVVYRSANGGSSWKDADQNADRNASDAPYMYNNYGVKTTLKAGNWIDNMRIDPFNSDRVMYGMGSGIWSSNNITNCENNKTVNWNFLDKGVEEMGAYGLISPPSGAPLLSVVGDAGGFRHTDLTVSPGKGFFTPPGWGTNTAIDFAQNNPNIVVRTYFAGNHGAFSTNNGQTWTQFTSFATGGGQNGDKIAVSADGDNIVWAPENTAPSYSVNKGTTWTACSGIPSNYWYTIKSDRVNNNKFYAYHRENGYVYLSTDGGKTFTRQGFVKSWGGQIVSCPTIEGDIWVPVYWNDGNGGLYHSTNSGQTFTKIANVGNVNSVTFGKAAPGKTYPTLFLLGVVKGAMGFYASIDGGNNWSRINDNDHQYGYDGFIEGDQSTFGRVYFSSHCMGIVYGQIKDCTGTWGGSAYKDSCGTCVGGNTGLKPCVTYIDEKTHTSFLIMPNPFSKDLTLQVDEPSDYYMTNLSGILIEKGTCNNTCQIGASLFPGVYFLTVVNSKWRKTVKVIKNK